MKLKKTPTYLATVIFLLLINVMQLKAQGPGLPGPPCGSGDPDAPDVDCPIDTSVILLVAAILFLSVKKMIDKKQVLKEA